MTSRSDLTSRENPGHTNEIPERDARRPIVARTRKELATALAAIRRGGSTIGLVPTMGALHAGHRSLFHLAARHADTVVASIFVNPLQFSPTEDLDRYPRTFEADLDICAEDGVALVFAPPRSEVYPTDPVVRVTGGGIAETLEGATRPGHFDGVLTVVTKLFNLFRPDLAVFGEKDAQQLALVRRMVADLDMPLTILAGATVREPDGLALSSRNAYLSASERRTARALSEALRAGTTAASSGASPAGVREAARTILDAATHATPPLHLDYLALADPLTFTEIPADHTGAAVLLVAGTVGTTHLIDNTPVTLGSTGPDKIG